MQTRFILILLFVLLLLSGPQPSPTIGAVDTPGVLVEWEAPSYRLTTVVGDDGQTYTRVELEPTVVGYVNGDTPGWPSLPSLGKLVALPPSGEYGLELIEAVYHTVPLDYPVEPAPTQAPLQFDASGQPLRVAPVFTRDEAAYASAAPFPAEPVTLGDAVWMRDHRLVRLTFSPFRYRPAQGTLDVVRHLRVRVWWEPPTATASVASTEDPFDNVLAGLVLNPSDLNIFRAQNRAQTLPNTGYKRQKDEISVDQRAAASLMYKVQVEKEGIYALDYAALAAAGLPMSGIDPHTLRLTHDGVEVAAQWEGDGDTIFETGERLLFYGRPQLTRYAGYDVYWLSWGGDAGQRMATRSGAPAGLLPGTAWATAFVEENVDYDPSRAGRDGDRWFWHRLKLPDLTSASFGVPLETPRGGTTGELTVWLRSFTSATPNPDHHVRFRVNGTHVGDVHWDGEVVYAATLGIPSGLLHANDNTVGLSMPGDTGSEIEGTWVDAIAVTYVLDSVSGDVARFRGQGGASVYNIGGFSTTSLRVYDVTGPNAPRVVTGFVVSGDRVSVGDAGHTPAEYLILTGDQILAPQAIVAAKSVSDPPSGADYVIITHPNFQAALSPLVAHRTAQGLRVVIVDVEAIYDQFGDGRMHPTAIRSFLAHAYANWPEPVPRYVLLVGDATYDPRRYRPDSNLTFLPAYLADVDTAWSEAAADNRYADLTGDPLPELRLGRFPVNTPAEAEAIVDKILSYETDPLSGVWNRRLVFGADNPSSAGNHPAHADAEFITYANSTYGLVGSRVYLSETGGAPHLYTDAEAAQNALIAEINQGALLYSYFGHASWHQEAVLETDGYAPLFHRDHIAQLTNHRRWPVVLHMTCLTGRYIHLTSNTLDESLLRTADVGAVAVWGPSGNGIAAGHRILHRTFYQSVFDNRQAELSTAIHAALVSLYAAGIDDNLIETYHLFGDPALGLQLAMADLQFSVFLPIIAQSH